MIRRHSRIGSQSPHVQSAWQTRWPQESPFSQSVVSPGTHPVVPVQAEGSLHGRQRHVESQVRVRVCVPLPHPHPQG